MSRMFLASGEAGETGASPPLPARAVPVSTSASGNAEDEDGPAHRRWHSTRRARTDARATSRWRRRELRGLRQRRRPAARTGLPARGRRARLRPAAGPRGAARLLALALALPRRRGHLPAERQRRRRLPERTAGASSRRACRCCTKTAPRRSRRLGELDRLAVDEHAPLLELAGDGPARDGEQHRVELVLGAALDQDLPALVLERHQVGAGERHQVADQLRGGAGCRRFDPDGGNGGPLGGGEGTRYLSRRATKPRRARPGPRRAPRA